MKNPILLTSLVLLGSQMVNSQSKTGDLPVIDFSKNYPQKELRLQDIAEIDYIPLETTDDILLSDKAVLFAVSDNYILVYEPQRGDIFIFDHSGKLYSHFNHKGQSGWEYVWIGGAVYDEKNEEIFVCNRSIQVYSLNGVHKRTLKINTIQDEMTVYNFDDDALLVYDGVNIDPYFKREIKKKPYRLLSKKDGSLISVLDIYLPERYATQSAIIGENSWRSILMYFPQSTYYGQDFMLADISSDTLFLLTQNKKLTPVLTRKPSVHASEPRNVWAIQLTTDKVIVIGMILLDFNSRGGRFPLFMYEFATGEISKVSFINTESVRKRWGPGGSPPIAKNKTAELVQASDMVDAYKKKLLKGKAEKSLMALDENDNPVVMIVKFN